MLHVGLEVGDLLRPHRAGMARYTQCLIESLQTLPQQAQFVGYAAWRRLLGGLISPVDVKIRYFGKVPPKTLPDIFHATATVFPRWKSPIEIATVHDLYGIPKRERMTEANWRRVAYIQRADRIICVSHFTRKHLHESLDIPVEKSIAIPLAANAEFVPATEEAKAKVRAKYNLPSEFYLFVGRDRYNKNLHRLVTAYARAGIRAPLFIAGRQNRRSHERLKRRATRHRSVGSLHWLGSIADRELPALLSCASALCMPSTFEGFGLPVIEAMACGTRVLTSAGCATEEAAGGHGVLVDPKSIDSIAEGLKRVVELSDAQCNAARLHATSRTWADVAAETMQVYSDAAASREQGSARPESRPELRSP